MHFEIAGVSVPMAILGRRQPQAYLVASWRHMLDCYLVFGDEKTKVLKKASRDGEEGYQCEKGRVCKIVLMEESGRA